MFKASNIMTKKIVTVSPETEITAAAKLMFEHHFNGLPVVDEAGCLLGIICQDDLIIQQKRFLCLPTLPFLIVLFPWFLTRRLKKKWKRWLQPP